MNLIPGWLPDGDVICGQFGMSAQDVAETCGRAGEFKFMTRDKFGYVSDIEALK